MEEVLEKAVQIAVEAHAGQKDKSGKPYIFHPLRVMHTVETFEAKIIAVLHDVVEDTTVTFDDLLEKGIPKHLVITLRLITHDKKTSYEDYIAQLAENPLAARVKIADLKDNMNLSRLSELSDEDIERVKRYSIAFQYLKKRFPQLS